MAFCQNPFFIWFTGRSGSTMLCDLLDSHPQIHCREEDCCDIRVNSIEEVDNNMRLIAGEGGLFFRRLCKPSSTIDDASVEATLEYLNELYSANELACGFKFKFPNQPLIFPEVSDYLKSFPGMKVIELCRSNVLKQAISLQNIPRIKKLGVSRGSNSTKKVSLSPLELDVKLATTVARYFLKTNKEFRSCLTGYSMIKSVSYEKLCFETQSTVSQILEFLNVDPEFEVQTRFNKTTPDNLRLAVANYDELVGAIRGTTLEQFLD